MSESCEGPTMSVILPVVPEMTAMDPMYRAYNLIDSYCENLRSKGRKERSLVEYRYRPRGGVKAPPCDFHFS